MYSLIVLYIPNQMALELFDFLMPMTSRCMHLFKYPTNKLAPTLLLSSHHYPGYIESLGVKRIHTT
jgi:hypothetical protein